MAKGKYAKYINPIGRALEIDLPPLEGSVTLPLSQFNKGCFPETTHWLEIFYVYAPGGGFALGTSWEGIRGGQKLLDRPHVHTCDELFVFLGTNPQDPDDLGGEAEFWLGEGEDAEKFIINKPTVAFAPKNTAHCPIIFRRVDRPFLMVVILTGPEWIGKFVEMPPGFKR